MMFTHTPSLNCNGYSLPSPSLSLSLPLYGVLSVDNQIMDNNKHNNRTVPAGPIDIVRLHWRQTKVREKLTREEAGAEREEKKSAQRWSVLLVWQWQLSC